MKNTIVAIFFLGVTFSASAFTTNSFTESHVDYSPLLPSLASKNPPSFLHPCHRRHKRFNLCIKTTIQNFLTAVRDGSKELQLPSINPLFVRQMEISEGSGDANLHLSFKNVSIMGLDSTKIISVRSNLEDNKLEVTMKHPHLNILGNYSGDGQVKTFPIVGNGEFSFNMSDVSAAWIIYLKESEEHGEKHLNIDKFLIDVIPVEISAKFGEALDGDHKLGAALNQFFNENAQEIFKMTKPKISDALSLVFTNYANQVLGSFSSEKLLPH